MMSVRHGVNVFRGWISGSVWRAALPLLSVLRFLDCSPAICSFRGIITDVYRSKSVPFSLVSPETFAGHAAPRGSC